MAKITDAQMRREIMDKQLAEINEKTGRNITVEHMGSGNYWLKLPTGEGSYEQLGHYGSLQSKELYAFVNGMHTALCGAQFGRQ